MTFCSKCGTKLTAETRFCHECGSPVGRPAAEAPPPGLTPPLASYQAAGQPLAKKSQGKLALLISLLVLAVLLIGAGIYSLARGWPGSAGGGSGEKWQAAKVEKFELSGLVSDIFPAGVSLELKANGRFELLVEDERASGRWQLKGEELTLTGKAVQARGRILADEMILDDLFGYRFILYKEGRPEPAQGSRAGSEEDTGAFDWNGSWYGYFWVSEAFGEWAEYEDSFLDAHMTVELDATGQGGLTIWLAEDEELTVQARVKADSDHLAVTEGSFWDMQLDPVNWWLAVSASDPGSLLFIADSYSDPQLTEDDGFFYQFVLRPYGETWTAEEKGSDRLPPSYDDYLATLGQTSTRRPADPFGQGDLWPGQFSTKTKTISAAGLTLTYPVTASAAENIFGLPSIDLPGGYWVNASLDAAYDSLEDKQESLRPFAAYEKGFLFASSFKDMPCLVLMHDTDRENHVDASINIYVYINDKQLVQIDVVSVNGDLATMLADPDLWAIIHSVTW